MANINHLSSSNMNNAKLVFQSTTTSCDQQDFLFFSSSSTQKTEYAFVQNQISELVF